MPHQPTPEELFAAQIAANAIDQQTHNLIRLVGFLGPNDCNSMFASLIMNAVDVIPQPKWDDMVLMATVPCGADNCRCHEITGPLLETLGKLRKPFREIAEYVDSKGKGAGQ